MRHEDCKDTSTRKHLVGLLAAKDTDNEDNLDDEIHSIGASSSKVSWEDVKAATHADSSAQMLKTWVEYGLEGDRYSLPCDLKPFWRYKQQLTVEDGVVMYQGRIFIPQSLREIILKTLHSSHQGQTGMLLRAERSLFWPGMLQDIKTTRDQCRTCDIHSPSQPSLPPVQPEVPSYPFQHICSDYFNLYGKEFCVVVDRLGGWYDIYHAAGGTMNLVGIFTKIFQDMGVAESLTTDGGTTYVSTQFRSFLREYGVHHRVSSVGFPHGNTRSEVAVKSAKRLLRSNITDRGDLNTVGITRALLEYRNTPDRDIGLSPAELLCGRQLKDFLPDKPEKFRNPKHELLIQSWRNVAEWRENALSRRGIKIMDKLTEHVKDLPPLQCGDSVLIQNRLDNHPERWEK